MVTADNHSKILYLVRHGEAVSKDEDPARPLTQSGWLAVERIAGWAAGNDIRPDEIVHGGKLRAEQTAEILADYLMPAKGSNVRRGLGPDNDVRPLADSLIGADRTLMIVGHLPFLGRLVSQLVSVTRIVPSSSSRQRDWSACSFKTDCGRLSASSNLS